MTYAEMVHMHVSEAYLCDCGLVGNNAKQCACGNEQGLMNLAGVLNRDTESKSEQRTIPANGSD